VLIPARFALLLPLLCIFAPAQETTPAAASNAPALQKGRIVPAVRSAAKPEQSYALYVPTNYDPRRNWPIIYVFDPSARGGVPLELMKEAAESYGYLLAGSNNSHNGSWTVARDAAQEMWSDTHRFLSIDDRRVYFAGLSGGARVSAELARSCNCAHGVFLNSAGFLASSPSAPLPKPAFAAFLMAGMTDFNYGELVELDAQLESLGARHFLRRFDGGHEWAPAIVWQEALAWSAILEMKDNLRDRDPGVISAELARATSRLRQREDAGDLYFALGEYRGVAAAFDGLADTSALKQQLSVLAASPAVREGAKEEKAEIERQRNLEAEIFRIMEALRASRDGQVSQFAGASTPNQQLSESAAGALRASSGDQASLFADASARIARLREDSIKERRPESRRVLERSLGGILAFTVETGGQIMDQEQNRTAEVYFELGAIAHPDSTWPPLLLAKCHANLGDKKAALRDLERARENGSTIAELAEFVKANPKLAPLMDTPEFRELMAGASQ